MASEAPIFIGEVGCGSANITGPLDMKGFPIKNVQTPTDLTDAATKQYADTHGGGGGGGGTIPTGPANAVPYINSAGALAADGKLTRDITNNTLIVADKNTAGILVGDATTNTAGAALQLRSAGGSVNDNAVKPIIVRTDTVSTSTMILQSRVQAATPVGQSTVVLQLQLDSDPYSSGAYIDVVVIGINTGATTVVGVPEVNTYHERFQFSKYSDGTYHTSAISSDINIMQTYGISVSASPISPATSTDSTGAVQIIVKYNPALGSPNPSPLICWDTSATLYVTKKV